MARKATTPGIPNTQFAVHKVGKLGLTVSNFATFGTGSYGKLVIDGEEVLSCEYPINSNVEYLYTGALWIGAVLGEDTLVSVGHDGWYGITELLPDAGDAGAIIARSTLKSSPYYDPQAVSEQDFIATYTDTATNPSLTGWDPIDDRPHIPLYVSVRQSSYAWSYTYAEDFLILDYQITNIGSQPLHDMYLGIYVDGSVYHLSRELTGSMDDICGFRRETPMVTGICLERDTADDPWIDTINVAWIADNDGDPTPGGAWDYASARAATGTKILRTPNLDANVSFNWWVSNMTSVLDFGPRRRGTLADPFQPFGTQLGTPLDDKNKYYIMRHPEFDYDQLFCAVSHVGEGFLSPPNLEYAIDFANGFDTRYLLSFGPFDAAPGETLPVTIAYIAGDDFHVSPNDFAQYFDPLHPDAYYRKLSFSDLDNNARWASWVFDNPGIDTDGDGDSGTFCWNYVWEDTTLFNPDSSGPAFYVAIDSFKTYYRGDGVPDFKGASPPPPPRLTVVPGFGTVTLRWNGQESESHIDAFTGRKDFEGYHVYFAEGNRLSDYVLLSSYDIEDYRVFRFDALRHDFFQVGPSVTRDQLRQTYGAALDPAVYYNGDHYFTDPQSGDLVYCVPQERNQSDLSNPLGIHRVYPDARRENGADTTEDGYLRYYEYEFVVDNLQPSRPLYFAVTAFDYASAGLGVGTLESSPLLNSVREYPLPSTAEVEQEGLTVMVYPNPYRIDGGYADVGYENRDRTESAEWARAIHFANLPRVCTIRIFTLNGDLVQEIEHDRPDGGPGSQHEVWNVISKNTQAVVTGVYLWQVSSAMGDQIGKLVIIK